mmetsp:Transcript_118020/g.235101  ORF Transcript_118020/g.235101 Transcript_118020/m.235101 type:complete len:137 (+) Transcript_118020:503-913(+)
MDFRWHCFQGQNKGHQWASMEAKLRASGGVLSVILKNNHGDSSATNIVRLLKNGVEVERPGANEERTIKVPFVQGDKIKIDEHFGLIVLKLFTAICYEADTTTSTTTTCPDPSLRSCWRMHSLGRSSHQDLRRSAC